jgi:hypothetical protein
VVARHEKMFSPIGQHVSRIRFFLGLTSLLVVRTSEGTMGANLWRDYLMILASSMGGSEQMHSLVQLWLS